MRRRPCPCTRRTTHTGFHRRRVNRHTMLWNCRMCYCSLCRKIPDNILGRRELFGLRTATSREPRFSIYAGRWCWCSRWRRHTTLHGGRADARQSPDRAMERGLAGVASMRVLSLLSVCACVRPRRARGKRRNSNPGPQGFAHGQSTSSRVGAVNKCSEAVT